MTIEYWIINATCFSVPCMGYLSYKMYRSIKEKDAQIERLISMIENMQKVLIIKSKQDNI